VPVRGPIFRYANLFTEVSGATSVEQLALDFGAAVDNPAVAAIVLEIDSPGGMVAGVSEFAGQVRAATKRKPVVAYVSDLGASAAYWIASAAGELVVSDTARVGSIGVVLRAYRDTDNDAIKFVSAQSPRKQVRPDSDTGAAIYQAEVDALAEIFISAVAAYRAVSAETVAADFGQGALLVGAAAVAAGMADRLGTLENIIAGLAGSTREGGSSMQDTFTRPAAFTEDAARTRYNASPDLQAEFGGVEAYVAYARAEAAGKIRITGRRPPVTPSAVSADQHAALDPYLAARARAMWQTTPQIQARFVTAEAFVEHLEQKVASAAITGKRN
jgi:ClpP class serine protease